MSPCFQAITFVKDNVHKKVNDFETSSLRLFNRPSYINTGNQAHIPSNSETYVTVFKMIESDIHILIDIYIYIYI
jgi:hypothetical protein